jgi:hypothetical protein
MTPRVVIGLASPLPHSGKSEVAKALASAGCLVKPFANTLKEIGVEILVRLGVCRLEARRFLFIDKHEVIPELGVTGRHFLQTLGTDWGRNCINRRIWVNAWSCDIRATAWPDHSIVADDVRFPEEVSAIKSLGGQLWWITRPGLEPPDGVDHESEGRLAGSPLIDRVIVNSGSIEQLHEVTLDALRFLQQAAIKQQ